MAKENKTEDTIGVIKKYLQELLLLLKVEAEASVEEKEEIVYIQLETSQPGVLIGYHGETLSSLQFLLGIAAYRHFGKRIKIVVNIGDYRQRRKEILERLAFNVAEKVKETGQSQSLMPMSSFERRIIHLALANDDRVETVSEGEGQLRHVVVKPK